ncbi:hypothetical protein TRFO_11517 [Tritrichomonas foetus]|uniref:Guanylate cyclase domain-containing protein n=1 Tax=Tritrichomonas foetus TaxID=1144522 RepID=A0A1J4J318_9EUKA|nr:hypothetical protein TRFO_11517 [Tritrichomonas foetus]|eukprot:OHS93746.1 hypothetical protein TRFO_11517 [Tritrichomonas foetus]
MHNLSDFSVLSDVSRRQKYRRLLKRRTLKNFRDDCFRFFDYVYTMAPAHENVILVMRVYHFIQMTAVLLSPYNTDLWPKGSLLGRIINIFAVITNFCTADASELAFIIITSLLYLALVAFICYLYWNLRVFQKYTKINAFAINLICIVLNAFVSCFLIVLGVNFSKGLNSFIHGKEYLVMHIILFIIGILLACVFFLLQVIFVTPSLTFRPQTIHLLDAKSAAFYFASVYLNSLFSSLSGSILNAIPLFIIFVILLCFHIIEYLRPDYWGSYEMRGKFIAFYEMCTVFVLVESFLFLFDQTMNEIVIFVAIIFYIIMRIVNNFYVNYVNKCYLQLCEKAFNEPDLFDKIEIGQVVQILKIGFEFGHQYCHSWHAFEVAEKCYPGNKRILFLFMRYAAIYPDDAAMLKLATRQVQKAKKHSLEMKYLLFQMYSLYQQRERGLSKSLKKKLSHILEKTEKCRNQMRFIWESVIRGNITDLETLSMALKKNEEDIQREYNQLCLVYPNNPYVASAFAAFLGDIMCKDKEASEYVTIYRLLRNGARTRIERTYFFATSHIKTLPTEAKHAEMIATKLINPRNDSHSQSIASIANLGTIGDMNDPTEDKSQQKYIEAMIDSVHLPSMKYGPVLIFSSVSLIFPIMTIFFVLYVLNHMKINNECISLVEDISLEQVSLANTFVVYTNFLLNKNQILKSNYVDVLGIDQEDITNIIERFRLLTVLLNSINTKFPKMYKTGYFNETLTLLFTDTMNYIKVFPNETYGEKYGSYEFYLSNCAETAMRYVIVRTTRAFEFRAIWTYLLSTSHFLNQSIKFSDVYTDEIRVMMQENFKNTMRIVMSTGLVALFIFLGITAFVFTKMHQEKGALFRCFKSLPKNTISSIVGKLNSQSGKHNDEENTHILTSQEEHSLRALTMMQNQYHVNYSYYPVYVILCIFSISVICTLLFIIYSQRYLTKHFPKLCSVMSAASDLHSTFSSILLNGYRVMMYNMTGYPFSLMQSREEIIRETLYLINSIPHHMHKYRFGDSSYNSSGLSGISTDIIDDFTTSPEITISLPDSDDTILEMLSLENAMVYLEMLFQNFFYQLMYKPGNITLIYPLFNSALSWIFNTSYPDIVLRTVNDSIACANELQDYVQITYITVPVIIFDLIIFICGILLIPPFKQSGEVAQWAMRLMLFCQPNIVLQSRKIVKILSNDFTSDENEDNEESSDFYEKLIAHLPDAAIFLNKELVIHSTNSAFEKLFGEFKIGTSLFDLFVPAKGKESSYLSFDSALRKIMSARVSPCFSGDIDVTINEENKLLHLSLIAVNGDGEIQNEPILPDFLSIFSLEIKNITAFVDCQTKLDSEKQKISNLLAQVLPQPIVTRVMNCEPNICFSVQSASIVFIDIVEFSKWSSTVEPSLVMNTLNILIEQFDRILGSFNKLTKIKSLGDNYLAAGGIFDEVNQPQVHAFQAISFGLDVISALDLINVQTSLSLRIRVGLNTGGPVIAGLLNLLKPSFEVLGDTISLASELEKTGVPMNVHIPHHVLSIINEDEFLTKKTENIIFKGQEMQTYLVSGYLSSG